MSISIPPLVQKYLDFVEETYGLKIEIKNKSESKLHKLIAKGLKPFNPNYMTYVTTFGKTIWVSDTFFKDNTELGCLEVITHEVKHALDNKKVGNVLWALIYGAPQIFALLALLSVFGLIWPKMFLCLFFLLFAAPIPALGRYWAELRGYRTTVLFYKKVHKFSDEAMEAIYSSIADQLTGKWYYFTWPFRGMVMKNLRDHSFMDDKFYKDIEEFLKKENLIP